MICGIVAGQALGGCAHPMDVTEVYITGLGYDGRLALSNGDQTGTYTIQGGLASSEIHGAGSLTAIDFTAGIKAIEHTFSLPTITGGAGASAIEITASMDENPFTLSAPVRVKALAKDDGTFSASVLVDNVTVYSGACSATGRFTIIANGSTGVVVVKLNGSALTLSDSTFATQDGLLTCSVQEVAGISGAYTGQTASITLVTSAANMLHATGAGASDICGSLI